MSVQTVIALVLALAATGLTNVAYLREHDAAAALPTLSLRRPLHSIEALLTDRSWLVGFALESGGFALYVAALALAPLTLVQSVSAGGIGILAAASVATSLRVCFCRCSGCLRWRCRWRAGAVRVPVARRPRSSSGSRRRPERRPSWSRSGGDSAHSPSPRGSPADCSSRSVT